MLASGAQLAGIYETKLLLRELFCAFDGGEIGSTSAVKMRGDRKQRLDANDNAPIAMALAA